MLRKRLLAFLMIAALLLSSPMVNALNTIDVSSKYDKVHFYFDDEELISIDSHNELSLAINDLLEHKNECYAISSDSGAISDKDIVITVEFQSDYFETKEYQDFQKCRENIKSSEEILLFREQLNSFSKEYHNSLIKENIDKLTILDYSSIEVIDYSPYVQISIKPDNVCLTSIVELCEDSSIESISLAYEAEAEAEESTWATALQSINAASIVNNGTYTGDGVRIGVYESGGVCDTSNVNLADKSITIRDSSVGTSPHATYVVSILTQIAPNADYFVSNVNELGISWFIEQRCDIVNCSFGYYNNTYNASTHTFTDGTKSYRNDIDGVYDYQVKAHFITVCKSAGNYNSNNTSSSYNPNNKISSPGYAYNVITVGGVEQASTGGNRWVHHSGASYVCDTPKVKPNVSAQYSVYIPNIGVKNGTSYSSPLVAGAIALLMEHDSSFKGDPVKCMSIITCTANRTFDYLATIGNFDNKVGAGTIDLEQMINLDDIVQRNNTSGLAGTNAITKTVYLSAGQTLYASIAWDATAVNSATTSGSISISGVYLTNYDLRILDPYNNVVTTSSLSPSNVEKINMTITVSGTYTIVVYQNSPLSSYINQDHIVLSYSYN